jgi:uncharacterized membrane protein
MTLYEIAKLIHILGTVLLFGTGMGTAFFLLMAYRSRDLDAIRVTARHVVIADWLFTAPAVVVQPISGVVLMLLLGYRYDTVWFAAVVILFAFTGACWIPVVFIQYRLRDLAISATSFEALPQEFHTLMRRWIVLGVPAFSAVLLIVVLMVTHFGVATSLGGRAEVLMPGTHRLLRDQVERPRDKAILRDFYFVVRAVGHRHEGGAAIERIDPRQVMVIALKQRPHIDLLRGIQRVHGAGRAALAVDVGIAAADALQPVGGVEAQHIGRAAPLENARVDLPIVAAQRVALGGA